MEFIELAIVALLVVSMWFIFLKAGEGGWKSIIPFYSGYIEFKLFWEVKYFWIYLIVSIVYGVLYGVQSVFGSTTPVWYAIILIIVGLGLLALSIASLIFLGKSFGKSSSFIVGLVLLGIVFLPILAFGNSEYIGPKGEPITEEK